MKKVKTRYVFGVILLFFGLTLSSSLNAELLNTNTNQLTSNEVNDYEEFTIYRFGLNGDVTPLEIQVPIIENKNFRNIVADKCKELFDNDKEMQEFKTNDENTSNKFEVKSEGKGFFFCLRPLLLKNRRVLLRSVLICRYFFEGDYTIIKENETSDWTPVLEDVHEIRIIGFTGYIYFDRFRVFRNVYVNGYTVSLEWRTPKWPRNPWIK
jgi:hypothetical protein